MNLKHLSQHQPPLLRSNAQLRADGKAKLLQPQAAQAQVWDGLVAAVGVGAGVVRAARGAGVGDAACSGGHVVRGWRMDSAPIAGGFWLFRAGAGLYQRRTSHPFPFHPMVPSTRLDGLFALSFPCGTRPANRTPCDVAEMESIICGNAFEVSVGRE